MSEKQERSDVGDFEKGDRVEYYPTGNQSVTSIGKIVDILTHDITLGQRTVHAQEDHPRYLIQNEHTGKQATYYLENLIRIL